MHSINLRNLYLLFKACEAPITKCFRLLLGFTDELTLSQPWQRYDGIVILRQIDLFQKRDSPIRCLYRMYEFLCCNESNQPMLETQYFWDHSDPSWRLISIPDPEEHDTERYAILASLVESLVLAFNWRIGLGGKRGGDSQRLSDATVAEQCPYWARDVPPLSNTLIPCEQFLIDGMGLDLQTNDPFTKRHIVANAGNIFSI